MDWAKIGASCFEDFVGSTKEFGEEKMGIDIASFDGISIVGEFGVSTVGDFALVSFLVSPCSPEISRSSSTENLKLWETS